MENGHVEKANVRRRTGRANGRWRERPDGQFYGRYEDCIKGFQYSGQDVTPEWRNYFMRETRLSESLSIIAWPLIHPGCNGAGTPNA
jgi:hypothetical protein